MCHKSLTSSHSLSDTQQWIEILVPDVTLSPQGRAVEDGLSLTLQLNTTDLIIGLCILAEGENPSALAAPSYLPGVQKREKHSHIQGQRSGSTLLPHRVQSPNTTGATSAYSFYECTTSHLKSRSRLACSSCWTAVPEPDRPNVLISSLNLFTGSLHPVDLVPILSFSLNGSFPSLLLDPLMFLKTAITPPSQPLLCWAKQAEHSVPPLVTQTLTFPDLLYNPFLHDPTCWSSVSQPCV